MRLVSVAPLQFDALPFGVEVLVLAVLSFLIPVVLALWVLLDARDRTDHPLAWGLTVLLGGLTPFYVGAIAVTVLYSLSREELGSIPPPEVSGDDVQRGEVLGELVQGPAVTGMGPEGQARWEGRADAGLRANGSGDENANGEQPDGDEGDGEGSEPSVGGFEMAEPVEENPES